MKKSLLSTGLLSIICTLWSLNVVGQVHVLPEPQMTGNPPPVGLVVPIDGGISLLAAAGVILGVYFLRARRKI